MREQPLISVIIPVYNTRQYLPRLLASIQAQTYRQLELLIVDDGSSDGSGAYCDEAAASDSRIQVFHQENAGVSAARNRGLSEARGEYISFLDSDDAIDPRFYQTLLSAMRKTGATVAACNTRHIFADGSETLSVPPYQSRAVSGPEAFCRMQYQREIDSSPCNKLFQREAIGGCRFTEGLTLYEDYEFLNQVLWCAPRVALCGKALYLYYQNESSAMHCSDTGRVNYLRAGQAVDQVFMRGKALPFLAEAPAARRAAVYFCDTHLMAVAMQLLRTGDFRSERFLNIRRDLKKSLLLYLREREAPLRFRLGAGLLVLSPRVFALLAARYPQTS